MNLSKIFTERNAFSREYGTWLIVLFNLILVPILLHNFTYPILIFWLSILFFLMFRFELLDLISTDLQFSKKSKVIKSVIYLLLSVTFFCILIFNSRIDLKVAFLVSIFGIAMLLLNIATRRRKGKRQNIIAQIVLVCFIAFLGALNYNLLTGCIDKMFFTIFLLSSIFYSNSVLYVRSKTLGAPYDIYALMFSIFSISLFGILVTLNIYQIDAIIILIPTFVKTLDNVILTNIKVPLRRIGINETIHCIIFIGIFCILKNHF